jgi:membrane-associated protein
MDLMSLLGPVMTSPLLYPLLAALVSLDGVVPVIPSEAAVLTAGVFSRTGTPDLLLVIAAAALGVFVSDHLVYGLSRSAFGPRLLGRFPRLGRAVAAAGQQLESRIGPLIVISRFLPGGRLTMNVASGTTRVPLSRFSPASALAAVAWATYHAGLGTLGGAAFATNPLLGLASGVALSLVAGGIVEVIRRRHCRRTTRPTGAPRPRPADDRPRTVSPEHFVEPQAATCRSHAPGLPYPRSTHRSAATWWATASGAAQPANTSLTASSANARKVVGRQIPS